MDAENEGVLSVLSVRTSIRQLQSCPLHTPHSPLPYPLVPSWGVGVRLWWPAEGGMLLSVASWPISPPSLLSLQDSHSHLKEQVPHSL